MICWKFGWVELSIVVGRSVTRSILRVPCLSILMVIRDVNKPVLEEQLMVFLSVSTYSAIDDVPKNPNSLETIFICWIIG
jgi:hypothetical protein